MQDIEFKTERGHYLIHLDEMFPCSKDRFKRVMKLVMWDLSSCDTNKEIINQHFRLKIEENETNMKALANRYFIYKQEFVDTNRIIESGKHPNGIPITKTELKDFKERAKHYKIVYSSAEVQARQCKRLVERYKEHLEMLEGME